MTIRGEVAGLRASILGLSVPFGEHTLGIHLLKTPTWKQLIKEPFMHSIATDIGTLVGATHGSPMHKDTQKKATHLKRLLRLSLQYEGFTEMLKASKHNFSKKDFGHTDKLVTLLCMASAVSSGSEVGDFNLNAMEARFMSAAIQISTQMAGIAEAGKKKVDGLTNGDLLNAYFSGQLVDPSCEL